MSNIPSFLRKGAAMPPPPPKRSSQEAQPVVRAGSFALIAQPAPWRFALTHDRSEDLLLMITRGQGRVTVGGVRLGLGLNHAVFVPGGTLFSLDIPSNTQALLATFPRFSPGDGPQESLHLAVRDSLAQAELTGYIDSMRRELSQGRPDHDSAVGAYIRLIGVWLRRQVEAGETVNQKTNAARRLSRRYAQAVARGFRSDRLVNDYASALDVTTTHLTRVCKSSCGKTAADLLTERKLHAARVALELPSPPIKQIAEDLGFHSSAYFTRFIKNQTGQAPSALRRQAKPQRPAPITA
ncbi:helix-turn-helix transcriptional regulator [Thalassococcus lentus]|uniref:Helix-turn-helix transcriptional regulator n=1 Tax=Thalassococcus lentus TaxID=1210524 RepID=A0ABT4XQN3_9RHOB|nr:helix-turn-helix transcriptional regulator [Thalassococcus lentus]MDA7424246.1 helix-turn-helix transcriptional regulator [Thalassococcus lentus]